MSLKGHEHEALIKTALFKGMRSGELLGCIHGLRADQDYISSRS